MIDVTIDGKLKRVFSLRQENNRLVYLDLKKLTRVDYQRVLEVEEKGGDLLTELRNTTADNGRNLLALIDNIIDVAVQDPNDSKKFYRMSKPGEPKKEVPVEAKAKEETAKEEKPAPKRRGPGRPRKKPAEE